MKKIVVGIDGSEHGAAALDWAREMLKGVPDAAIHLVHAYQVPRQWEETIESAARKSGEQVLNEAAAKVSGITVTSHLRSGVPAAEMLAVAQEVDADLVAVGSRGLGPAARFFLGSVSTQVVHHADRPVMVVRKDSARPVRRVLVGVDGSPHSVRTLQFAAAWAGQSDLVAMHVVHLTSETRSMFEGMDVSLDGAAERTGQQVIRRTVEDAGLAPDRVEGRVGVGSPVQELVLEARDGGYDLVVMGTKGHGLIGDLFLGSVSEGVLRLAPCPVIIVN